MAHAYTIEGLDQAVLPGYLSPANVNEVFCTEDVDWQPVISLTIIAEQAGRLTVMNGVRKEEVNPTHPNVVSTPTGRLPLSIARSLYEARASEQTVSNNINLRAVEPQNPQVVAAFRPNTELVPDRQAILPYVAGSVLAGKLGCAAALESASTERPFGTVSLASILAGFSFVGQDETKDGQPVFEPLLMFGAVLKIHEPNAIPEETESYSHVSWTSLEDFVAGVETKDAARLMPTHGQEAAVKVCVRGLCLATTKHNVSGGLDQLIAHLAEPEPQAAVEPPPR